ncbi:hypothetical protein GCM10010954_14460 [Halobacillus andaensis]|uniref:Uncharacterized protein n=1 Tax=Halobacillus andaensis TaxID=1176239 RepID=A0A917B1T8_HALAA|nr:hypothetical protein [Halobacillus andaensis]MBP2004250.1 DNA repair exonuclease SbcCD ATPase subunit [Halobacillus andaensis]GGF16921.1 hypothetical protein GCM10010954_14460 [Halobacillus andaensis]
MARTAKVIIQLRELFEEVDKVKGTYEEAEQKAKKEQADLLQDIQEKDAEVKQLYKSYVLDNVTLETYNAEKQALQDMHSTLQIIEAKIRDVTALKQDELKHLLSKIEELNHGYYKADRTNKATQRQKLLKAKEEYLQAINDAQKVITTTARYRVLTENLRVDAGVKKMIYANRSEEYLDLVSNPFNNTKGIDVTREDIRQAYWKR